MTFIDEVEFNVGAGSGGHGCLSFRREKYIPFGGPDGGDGGDGGSVYLQGRSQIQTLIDLHHKPQMKAKNGQCGAGRNRTGKAGEDLVLEVPLGTVVFDANTDEMIGEVVEEGQRLCVAHGGEHGRGNIHFKSSTNRAPRQTTQGEPGEQRRLRLELRVLADVGLLGLPNAGKSTLIRAVSGATPKVANYRFTTLRPYLGVVSVGPGESFVLADIPGLIAGAAEGAGLGIQFLKHLARCRSLWHVVDATGQDDEAPLAAIRQVEHELVEYDADLINRPRHLILNKCDLLAPAELEVLVESLKQALAIEAVICVSALNKQGTDALRYLS